MSHQGTILSQFGENAAYIGELYELYLSDPDLLSPEWRSFFSSLAPDVGSAVNGHAATNGAVAPQLESQRGPVEAFRRWGHTAAKINPLQSAPKRAVAPSLEAAREQLRSLRGSTGDHGFSFARAHCSGPELLAALESTYAGSIGFEYEHLEHEAQRNFCRDHFDGWRATGSFSPEQRRRFFGKLIAAEGFEVELHKKYVGVKRFSLQGSETLIPMFDLLLEESARRVLHEVVIGMAHRGRLNVLHNTVGKPLANIFTEFEDLSIAAQVGAGDVKYHLGFSSLYTTPRDGSDGGQSVQVTLAPNPSHLEFVNPVVEGIVRGKQDLLYNHNRKVVVPVLIHGDGAFVGQGVVYETINLAGVDGYRTGGTIHIVINNQIGFTTNPEEDRSSMYCTDMPRGTVAPVLHVNGEDVEACLWATKFALDFRQQFGADVILDLYSYRKYGHNEGDDPGFTQPLMYEEINKKKSVAKMYGESLVARGELSQAELDSAFETYAESFKTAHRTSGVNVTGEACALHGMLQSPAPKTAVSREALEVLGQSLLNAPGGFVTHPKVLKTLEKRVEAIATGTGIDWGFAEGLALGSLILDGCSVRFSGQDACRGTFSQRHLGLVDNATGKRWFPYHSLPAKEGGRFELYNSTLSEAGVVGFEFGYGTIARQSLVIWEGQFGDFANGAQVHIDQFLASSEAKWNQRSGLVLLLPHGFEGQGPEHSSARLERYLQLCAENNMTVCYPSQAAQQFHLIRRQGMTEIQRPVIVMTPKSLLRFAGAAATVKDLTEGSFQPILVDRYGKKPKTIICCSGKVFYDVDQTMKKLAEEGHSAIVVRLEQLYPFPKAELQKVLREVSGAQVAWLQEEPRNMGGWSFVQDKMRQELDCEMTYLGRPESASPATGSHKRHGVEQQMIMAELAKVVKQGR